MTAKKKMPSKERKKLSKKEESDLLKKGRGWDEFRADYNRLKSLYEWPIENVLLDIKIGLSTAFAPDSNPTQDELKAAGLIEDPQALNAPKNDDERRFVEAVVRPELKAKLKCAEPAKRWTGTDEEFRRLHQTFVNVQLAVVTLVNELNAAINYVPPENMERIKTEVDYIMGQVDLSNETPLGVMRGNQPHIEKSKNREAFRKARSAQSKARSKAEKKELYRQSIEAIRPAADQTKDTTWSLIEPARDLLLKTHEVKISTSTAWEYFRELYPKESD